jgi:hypothetical protein
MGVKSRYYEMFRRLDREGADALAVHRALFPEDGEIVNWVHVLDTARTYLGYGGKRLTWGDFARLAREAGAPTGDDGGQNNDRRE